MQERADYHQRQFLHSLLIL